MTSDTPPVVHDLSAVYQAAKAERSRYARLRKEFTTRFGREPDFFARSPDYAGFSVLPMALDRDVVIAVARTEAGDITTRIRLANVEEHKYPQRTFEHTSYDLVTIDPKVHEWTNYFKCGYKGVLEHLEIQDAVSFDALVDGNVPAGSGLSSSSAFVCCAALATLTANRRTMSKAELTAVAIRVEKYAGVETGGMDQAISIMAHVGSPLLIHFQPELSVSPITFPTTSKKPIFVIANTLVVADKHVTAPTNYNLRVVETRLAAALLSKCLHLKREALTLRDVYDQYSTQSGCVGKEREILISLSENLNQHLKEEPYTREKIAEALEISVDMMLQKYAGNITIRTDHFELYKRAKHVFEEACRVFQFRDICNEKAPYTGNVLEDLGKVMDASQKSCRDLYNCSCPEIDELTSIARASGAYGSRLTGAGWGGGTVSLVAEDDVAGFIREIKEKYFLKKWPEWRGNAEKEAKLDDYVFASKPSGGAAVLELGL
ncbi:galactokinase [Gaertneriomyces sp. JEL0708]|nr:galactokinase [Gaertneriomyces sp. JEL0708]